VVNKTKEDKITIIIWNIWFKTQLSDKKLSKLKSQLKKYIDKYSPDVMGIHEVLTDRETGYSEVIGHLESLGYYVESMPSSPIRTHWLIGNVIAYKKKPIKSGTHVLGPDTPARWRGHNGYNVSLMYGDIQLPGGKTVHFVLNYLAHIVPYNWRTHLIHLNSFQKFIAQKRFNTRTIVAGDFNEFKWMLPIWNRRFNRRTGNVIKPTWRFHGRALWPLQANYDNVCWDKDGSVELEDFQVLDMLPSDHSALLAIFKIV
jgi:endonuclease/exonuclease/phosphatase family metal-dependent hydrolase